MGLRRIPASSIDEPLLRQLWRFRLEHMDLEPGWEPERDYERFAADVRRDGKIWLELDGGGAILSSIVCRSGSMCVDGRRIQWVNAEYVYTREPNRPYPPTLFRCFLYTASRWVRRPLAPPYYAGPSCLPSFISGLEGISRYEPPGVSRRPPVLRHTSASTSATASMSATLRLMTARAIVNSR